MEKASSFAVHLRHVEGLRRQNKDFVNCGASLRRRNETAFRRIHWDDSASAYNNCSKTGMVTNLRLKEYKNFLENCKSIHRGIIQDALKKV